MSKLSTYGVVNARLRTRLSKTLDESQITALIKAGTTAEACAILHNTEYDEAASIFDRSGDIRLVEQFLFENEIRLFSAIERDLAGKPGAFARVLFSRYEIESLKKALRMWFAGRKREVAEQTSYLYLGYSRLKIDELLQAQNLTGIAELLSGTPYAKVISESDTAAGSEGRMSLFRLEINLDRHYFGSVEDAVKGLDRDDSDLAGKMLGVEIDLENLERIVRFRDLYNLPDALLPDLLIPSHNAERLRKLITSAKGSDLVRDYVAANFAEFAPLLSGLGSDRFANMVLLESLLEEILKTEIQRALRGYPFTLGIVLAYFFLIRRETRTVVLLLYAKYYDLEEDRARSLV